MKRYLYIICFILISAVFSGCFNDKNNYSYDNTTESSNAVSENNSDINTDNSSNILAELDDLKKAESTSVISNPSNNYNHSFSAFQNNAIQKPKLLNIDNKSVIPAPVLNSNLKEKITDLHISDTSLINSSMLGTYKIIFFGSQVIKVDNAIFGSVADMYYISNDCKKAQKLYPDIVNSGIKNQCSLITQSKILDGIVTISYDKKNNINIISRLQMEGGIIENAPADKYQYTVYSPIKDSVMLQGKGVTSWNYNTLTKSPSNVSNVFNTSTFQLNMLDDGLVRIDMILHGKMIKAVGKNMTIDAKNTIILEKISSKYEMLENKVQKQFSR